LDQRRGQAVTCPRFFLSLDKGFFVVFRFYGPLEGYIEKTWVMNDFERIN